LRFAGTIIIGSRVADPALTLDKQRGHEDRPDEPGSIGVLVRFR
jgi:hypothetical protein